MADLLPPEISKWQFVEETARAALEVHGFREARVDGTGVAALARAHAERGGEVARWYRFEGDAITGAVLGVAGPTVEAEVRAMLDGLSGELGARAYEVSVDRAHVGFTIRVGELVAALGEPAESFEPAPAVLIAPLGTEARTWALALARRLRDAGVRTDLEHRDLPLEAQLARAAALRARFAIVVSSDAPARGRVRLRDLATDAESEVDAAKVVAHVRQNLD